MQSGTGSVSGGGGGPPPPTSQRPRPGIAAGNNRNNTKNKQHNLTYKRGTGTLATTGTSLAPAKPEYLKYKVLVVHGIDKSVTKQRLQDVINEKAGKSITLHHIAPLHRELSWCATLAIELSDEDYDMLSQQDFWEERIKIRQWLGWRFWRSEKRPTKQEVKSSMRAQWS